MISGFPSDKFHFKRSSVLEGLAAPDLEYLQSRMVAHKYKRGQNIFTEGTLPNGIYYINKGKVKKYKSDPEGKEQIIYIFGPGELIGYSALICSEPYMDSAAALEDAQVSFISKEYFLTVLNRSGELSKNLLINLSHEFGVLVNSIATTAHKTIRERLALNLLILADKYRTSDDSFSPIEIVMRREDLANMVGIALETLVRLLHQFTQEGLIEKQGRKIRIKDFQGLIRTANLH